MKILIVAAHPDDEILGCGATAARLARAGHEIHFQILGEGVTSRAADRGQADKAALDALHAAGRRAAKEVGAAAWVNHNLPDNRFDAVPLIDVVKIVEETVQRLKPAAVYTHHAGDLNVDHQVTARAVLTATRPQPGHPVRDLYAFEVPSSSEWSFGTTGPLFRPNVFVDAEDALTAKLAALACYKDEMRPFPHPRSPEAVTAIAQRWGSVAGFRAAEAFELVRSVRP